MELYKSFSYRSKLLRENNKKELDKLDELIRQRKNDEITELTFDKLFFELIQNNFEEENE